MSIETILGGQGAPTGAPAAQPNVPAADPTQPYVAPVPEQGPAPEPYNPMQSRPAEPAPEPAPAPAAPQSSDAHLEQSSTASTTLAEFINNDAMQDRGTRLAVNFIDAACAGIDQERAFGRALSTGNMDLIDTNYLYEKLGNAAEQVIDAAHHIAEQATNATERVYNQLFDNVEGGEQTVLFAAKHFNSTATPEQIDLVRSLLDSGNTALMQHGVQLIVDSAQGIRPQAVPQHFGQSSGAAPLSRAEFGRMMLQNPNMPRQEYLALRERLAAGLAR